MYQTQLKKEKPHLLKWGVLISGLIFILLLLSVIYLYVNVMQEKSTGFNQAKQTALDETELVEVEDVQRFHGDEAYFVVSGHDTNDQPLFVFVPFEEESSIMTVDQPQTYTKEKVENDWKENCPTCSLTAITPGIIEETAVWEINYRPNKDTQIYEYITMEDRDLLEQLRFKKHFK